VTGSSDTPRFGERLPASTDADGRVSGVQAPEYGEYAPPGWVNPVAPVNDEGAQDPAVDTAVAPRGTASAPGVDPLRPGGYEAPPPSGPPVPGDPPRPSAPAARSSSFNRFATVALIAYGLFRVIDAAVATKSFASMFVTNFTRLGYLHGDFGSAAALQAVGVVSAVASVPLFLVVVVWALRRLRAGRNSWLPLLLTGVAVNVITGLVVVGVVMSDPSFTPPVG
jgi:hypothetical protein